MLKLTLANGAVVEIDDGDNAISNRDELCSVFAGSSVIMLDDDGDADVSEIVFDVEDIHDLAKYASDGDYYVRVVSAEWSFAKSGYIGCDTFKQFVQSEMNRYCSDDATWCYDLIENGCASGMVSSLIYTSDIIKVLAEHYRDIQYKVQDIADNTGSDNMGFLFGENGGSDFTFDRLVWLCFEESVRDVLRKLELEDV